MGVGSLNIIAGIISTIHQFLKISELNESHRVASIAWDKFYRNIRVEISKSPDERMPVWQMLKVCKEEFDRLMETSPVLTTDIISKFQKTFKKSDSFLKVRKPEICNELISTETFRYKKQQELESDLDVEGISQNQKNKLQIKVIENFKNDFVQLRGRDPNETEIIDNLKDTIPESEIEKYLNMREKNHVELVKTILDDEQENKLKDNKSDDEQEHVDKQNIKI